MVKYSAKIAAAAAVCLLLWELILRATVYQSPGYQMHPDLGRTYSMGTYVNGAEGFSRTHFNSLGFRGPELESRRPGQLRILANHVYGRLRDEYIILPMKSIFAIFAYTFILFAIFYLAPAEAAPFIYFQF